MSATQEEAAVDVRNLARRFGSQWVLRRVNLRIERGECVGVLGANGSGKSTLLRILGTLLRPNAGHASVHGLDVVKDAESVRAVIGVLSHLPGLYDDLSARENLRFVAAMLDAPPARISAVLDRVGLTHVQHDRVGGFSAGMQRRLALARLLMGSPRLLLLDEPYSNLDSDGVALINSVVREVLDAGGAALVVVHEVAPAREVLSRCVRLVNGQALPAELDAERESGGVSVAVGGR